MEIIAIIAEYNPFHDGHAWQIAEARRRLGERAAVLVVLSGSFVQRGEPALFDRRTRAATAVIGGADLVLELPQVFAVASAELFARGAVATLAATGLRGHLIFGSESADLRGLLRLAEYLEPEAPLYRNHLRQALDLGLSLAAARQQALSAVADELKDRSLSPALLSAPNDILAVEYLKALRFFQAETWQPIALPRIGSEDRQATLPEPDSGFASARALRQALAGGSRASALAVLANHQPAPVVARLMAAWQDGQGPVFLEDLALPILQMLRSRTADELRDYAGMGDGAAERLKAAARDAPSLEETIAAAMTRRLPRTRLQRAVIAALLGLRQDACVRYAIQGPRYLRPLAASRNGRYLLRLMRRTARLPVLARVSDALENAADPDLLMQAEVDRDAARLWWQLAGRPQPDDFDIPMLMR